MKKLFLIVVCLLFSTTLMCQSKLNKQIELMENTDGFTVVKISKPMFKFIENMNIDYPIQKLASKIEYFTLITADISNKENFPKNFNVSDVIATVNKQINELNYEELVSIKDGGTNVKMIAEKAKDDTVKNFIMVITDDKDFTLMVINGIFKMEDFNDFMSMVK
jgi:hypothetical protein